MSFILDALRKAELERRQSEGMTSLDLITSDLHPPPPNPTSRWWWGVGTLLALLGMAGWYWLTLPTTSLPPPIPASPRPPVPTTPTVATREPATHQTGITGKVVGIHPECWLEVSEPGGKINRIHLGGILCPEATTPAARLTRETISKLIFTKTVTITILELNPQGTPEWEVITTEGESLNGLLVKFGLAKATHPKFLTIMHEPTLRPGLPP